jgi:hypothetical protein
MVGKDPRVGHLKQGLVARESGMSGGALDAHKVIPKVDVARLVEIEEVDEAQVRILGTEPIHRVIPVATLGAFSADHHWNFSYGHDAKVDDGLDPGESVAFGSQERGGAIVMTAVSENQGGEEDLL